jgi:hypothetical protein
VAGFDVVIVVAHRSQRTPLPPAGTGVPQAMSDATSAIGRAW